MYLYFASKDPVSSSLLQCSQLSEGEVCLAVAPPKGQGKHLYRINISTQVLKRYAMRADLYHCGNNKFVHLPLKVAESFPRVEVPWSEPWNEFKIELPEEFEGANIWISRLGVSRSEWLEDGASLRLVLTEDFDPDIDWVVVEYLKQPRWELECLAGRPPYWTVFPRLWKEWVHDPAVRQSAINFILDKHPELSPSIGEVQHAPRRADQVSGWLHIAEQLAAETGPILFYGYSATKVAYMPLRIAQRLGWEPPIEKPKPADLEKEERNLLASLGNTNTEDHDALGMEQFTN